MADCPNCGESLEGTEEYCPECGEKIEDSIQDKENEEKENGGIDNSNNSKLSKLGWKRITLAILVIGVIFVLPKLPAILAGTGIQGAPGIEPLEVKNTSIEVKNLDEGLILKMRLRNPNSFNADLGRVEYEVFLADTKIASGDKNTYESIPSSSTVEVSSDIKVDLRGSLGAGVSTLGNIINDKETYVEVKGKWYYSVGPVSFSIPFEDKSEI